MTIEQHKLDEPQEERNEEFPDLTDLTDSEEEHPVYGPKPSAGPWMMSLRMAVVGAVLAIMVFALPEFRTFRLRDDLVLHTGYVFMVIPILSLIWGVFSISHPEHRRNWKPAVGAILLAAFSAAVLAYTATTENTVQSDPAAVPESERTLEMTEEELKVWREQRMRR
jgi:hypothetical protein